MSTQPTAGWFECSGISGVSLACGSVAMGIRLAYPHMALGLFDGKDVLLSLTECLAAPDQSYARAERALFHGKRTHGCMEPRPFRAQDELVIVFARSCTKNGETQWTLRSTNTMATT